MYNFLQTALNTLSPSRPTANGRFPNSPAPGHPVAGPSTPANPPVRLPVPCFNFLPPTPFDPANPPFSPYMGEAHADSKLDLDRLTAKRSYIDKVMAALETPWTECPRIRSTSPETFTPVFPRVISLTPSRGKFIRALDQEFPRPRTRTLTGAPLHRMSRSLSVGSGSRLTIGAQQKSPTAYRTRLQAGRAARYRSGPSEMPIFPSMNLARKEPINRRLFRTPPKSRPLVQPPPLEKPRPLEMPEAREPSRPNKRSHAETSLPGHDYQRRFVNETSDPDLRPVKKLRLDPTLRPPRLLRQLNKSRYNRCQRLDKKPDLDPSLKLHGTRRSTCIFDRRRLRSRLEPGGLLWSTNAHHPSPVSVIPLNVVPRYEEYKVV